MYNFMSSASKCVHTDHTLGFGSSLFCHAEEDKDEPPPRIAFTKYNFCDCSVETSVFKTHLFIYQKSRIPCVLRLSPMFVLFV